MKKNTICLWYDDDAEGATRFYAGTFPDSADNIDVAKIEAGGAWVRAMGRRRVWNALTEIRKLVSVAVSSESLQEIGGCGNPYFFDRAALADFAVGGVAEHVCQLFARGGPGAGFREDFQWQESLQGMPVCGCRKEG